MLTHRLARGLVSFASASLKQRVEAAQDGYCLRGRATKNHRKRRIRTPQVDTPVSFVTLWPTINHVGEILLIRINFSMSFT